MVMVKVLLKRRWRLVQPGECVEMDEAEAARIVGLEGAEYVVEAVQAAPVARSMTPTPQQAHSRRK
jgi:hypothetical protein